MFLKKGKFFKKSERGIYIFTESNLTSQKCPRSAVDANRQFPEIRKNYGKSGLGLQSYQLRDSTDCVALYYISSIIAEPLPDSETPGDRLALVRIISGKS